MYGRDLCEVPSRHVILPKSLSNLSKFIYNPSKYTYTKILLINYLFHYYPYEVQVSYIYTHKERETDSVGEFIYEILLEI